MKQQNAPQGPERPSHWNEEQNVRVSRGETELDYPVGTDADIELAIQHGFVPPMESTPVYLTEAPPKDKKLIRGNAMHLVLDTANKSYQLVGGNPNRTRLKIVNSDDTASVALIFDQNDNINVAGFWLGPGDDVEMYHNSPMWGKVTGGDGAATVEVYTEYEVDKL